MITELTHRNHMHQMKWNVDLNIV